MLGDEITCLNWLLYWECKYLLASVVVLSGKEVRQNLAPAARHPFTSLASLKTHRDMCPATFLAKVKIATVC